MGSFEAELKASGGLAKLNREDVRDREEKFCSQQQPVERERKAESISSSGVQAKAVSLLHGGESK